MSAQIINYQILNKTALAASITSNIVNLSQSVVAALQSVYNTAGVVGSLQYQVSNDEINWTNKGSPISITASGNTMTEWDAIGFTFARAVYTRTSGTLDLTINVTAK